MGREWMEQPDDAVEGLRRSTGLLRGEGRDADGKVTAKSRIWATPGPQEIFEKNVRGWIETVYSQLWHTLRIANIVLTTRRPVSWSIGFASARCS